MPSTGVKKAKRTKTANTVVTLLTDATVMILGGQYWRAPRAGETSRGTGASPVPSS